MVGIMSTDTWLDTFPPLFKLLPRGQGPQSTPSTRKLFTAALAANNVYKSRQDQALAGRAIVRAVAVFDTVSTRGRPTELRSRSTQSYFEYDAFGRRAAELPCCVEMAFQALALDEVRDDFKPDVWRRQEDAQREQVLLQTWFAGEPPRSSCFVA